MAETATPTGSTGGSTDTEAPSRDVSGSRTVVDERPVTTTEAGPVSGAVTENADGTLTQQVDHTTANPASVRVVDDAFLPAPGTVLENPLDICIVCGLPFAGHVDVHLDRSGQPIRVHTTCPGPNWSRPAENLSDVAEEELAANARVARAQRIGITLNEDGSLPEGVTQAQAAHIDGVAPGENEGVGAAQTNATGEVVPAQTAPMESATTLPPTPHEPVVAPGVSPGAPSDAAPVEPAPASSEQPVAEQSDAPPIA